MNEWLASTCQVLGPEYSVALGVACAALAVVLLAVIALGFSPLRARLGVGTLRTTHDSRPIGDDDGLLETWRLYRQLARRAPRQQLSQARTSAGER